MKHEKLFIAASKHTPEVHLDAVTGIFRITGISIPENASEFYGPVIQWVENDLDPASATSSFTFELDYFNSSSLKALYLLLLAIKKADKRNMEIRWLVEEDDESMIEAGETLAELAGVKMTFVTVEEK